MTLDEFVQRLTDAACAADWPVTFEPTYTQRNFRGEPDDVSPLQSGLAVGLKIGEFPILVSTLKLDGISELETWLGTLHSQMVVARTYMEPANIINAHLFLCVTESGTGDWAQIMDIAERDEAVCRKVVWMPDPKQLDGSFNEFIERTFLAQPWADSDAVMVAPLDHNEGVVVRALVAAGLPAATATLWQAAAIDHADDPDLLANMLVDFLEAQP